MLLGKVIAACILLAAQNYEVPPAVLLGIYQVEGGTVGQENHNTNGSSDLGPMQINTVWIPELAEHWGVSEQTAQKWVRDDPCTNVRVAAWILKQPINETGDLTKAISQYHSRSNQQGRKYRKMVINSMKEHDLLSSPKE